jgi:hypothetical protein
MALVRLQQAGPPFSCYYYQRDNSGCGLGDSPCMAQLLVAAGLRASCQVGMPGAGVQHGNDLGSVIAPAVVPLPYCRAGVDAHRNVGSLYSVGRQRHTD